MPNTSVRLPGLAVAKVACMSILISTIATPFILAASSPIPQANMQTPSQPDRAILG